jgi:hypothetical protein
MRKYLLLFLGFIAFVSAEGCRKPDYVYRTPCNDSTLLRLYEERANLSATERITFDSLLEECAKYEAAEESKGKLWPYLLAGTAALIGLILFIAWANYEPPVY